MFRANVAFDSLDSSLDLVDGGVFLGYSSIFPVRHRLLRTMVLESRERIAIVNYERYADEPEAPLIEPGLDDEALQARLDEIERHLLDVAILTIDRPARALRYRASPVISIPVYLLADDAGVSLDWDYARLLAGRRTDIVWDIALAQIAGISSYGPRTIVVGLYRATAGATIVARADGVEIALPDAITHDGVHDVPPDTDIESQLVETLTALVSARPLERARTAVELSGGMDSALAALAAADALGSGLLSVGAQFSGPMGEAQRARRMLLRARGGFDDLSIPAERFAPFGPASHRRVRHGVWPEDENYPEMFEAIFGMLQAAGIDAVISGFGGDELYIAYEGEDDRGTASDPTDCPLLSARGLAIARGARSAYPRAWLQESCWQSAASQAQRVLRYGLWPIYPYHNPALARFVSRLPRVYRRDRRLLRTTLTRLLGDPIFETDYVKENFDPVAKRGIAENRDYLADLVRRSPLSTHPDIDHVAILTALAGDMDALDRETFNALFRVLKICCFFQSQD